jgi:hypothetical protein
LVQKALAVFRTCIVFDEIAALPAQGIRQLRSTIESSREEISSAVLAKINSA